jgi:SM-20-related protein
MSTCGHAADFRILNRETLESARVSADPYDHIYVEGALREDCKARLLADAPEVTTLGSHPLAKLSYGESFAQLVAELQGAEFRQIVEQRFAIDLSNCETTLTARGCCGAHDGQIHTDLKRKIITLLLYLNPQWPQPGGRLRVLRSKNLEDYALEIPAAFGNLLLFRRCDHSWHGHHPYYGSRLSLQLNWTAPALAGLRRKVASLVSRDR